MSRPDASLASLTSRNAVAPIQRSRRRATFSALRNPQAACLARQYLPARLQVPCSGRRHRRRAVEVCLEALPQARLPKPERCSEAQQPRARHHYLAPHCSEGQLAIRAIKARPVHSLVEQLATRHNPDRYLAAPTTSLKQARSLAAQQPVTRLKARQTRSNLRRWAASSASRTTRPTSRDHCLGERRPPRPGHNNLNKRGEASSAGQMQGRQAGTYCKLLYRPHRTGYI